MRDGTFYPSRSLNAAQRLAFYASRLPLAEIATTFRFPPTPQLCERWVACTPEGFTFDVRAWSLLCGAPTWPESLWPDLLGEVKPSRRETTRLYRHRLPAEVVDECWQRFNYALRPLVQAGRLGVVVMRYPGWFRPGPSAWEELAELSFRLPGLKVAVELGNHRWFDGHACETTLAFLEELGLCFVCRDRPGEQQPVVAATGDVAFVRFPGRSRWWEHQSGPSAEPSAASAGGATGDVGPVQGAPELPELEVDLRDVPARATTAGAATAGARTGGATTGGGTTEADDNGEDPADVWEDVPWRYRYTGSELAAWVPAIADLAAGTSEVHLVMDNCWRADAVDNATTLLDLLR